MERRLTEICLSGLFVLVAGFAIWPPGNVYWNVVARRAGLLATVAIVLVLCALVGAVVVMVTGVSLSNFAIGGGLTYAVGTAAVERIVPPFDASEYSALYGLLLLCFVLGAAAVTLRHRRSSKTSVTTVR